MPELLNFITAVDLSDYTLIIPSVSVGNVPQLTVDLIISTYKLKKVATIWHPGIIPSVGADPFDPNNAEICTACELYASEDYKLAAIQLRSSIDRKYSQPLYDSLKKSIQDLKFKHVVILASSFAHEMHDVNSSKYRYVTNELADDIFNEARVLKLETVSDDYVIHGAGFAGNLYKVLETGTSVTLLMRYCSEGDNRPDAVQLLDILHKIIDNFKVKQIGTVQFPVSWDHVFGNPPPIGIY